jgi:transcriptional regulator NrdR family protein
MKCSCNGKTRVLNTVVKDKKVIRYRICNTCGKKITTNEVDVVNQQNDLFVLKKIDQLMASRQK